MARLPSLFPRLSRRFRRTTGLGATIMALLLAALLLLLLLQSGHAAETRTERAPKPSVEDALALRTASQALAAGDWSAAHDAASARLAMSGPHHPALSLALGNALYMRGDLHGAYNAFSIARRGMPDDPAAAHNLALASFGLGLWEECARAFETAFSLAAKRDPAPLRHAAEAWMRLHRTGEAARVMDAALPLVADPDEALLRRNAQIQTAAGRHGQGVRAFEAALARHPLDTWLWLGLADAEEAGGRLSHAAAALEAALRVAPTDRNATAASSGEALERRLAGLYLRLGLPLPAARLHDRPPFSRAEESDSPTASLRRQALLYEQAGQTSRAIMAWERLADSLPPGEERTQSRREAAMCCLRTGRNADAARLLRALVAQAPEDVAARLFLTTAALRLHDHATAVQALEGIPFAHAQRPRADRLLVLLR